MIETSIATTPRGIGLRRAALVALCAAGLILCGILLQATGGETSGLLEKVCAPRANVNCGHVLASRWAKIGGISATLLGFVYFGVLGVWFAGVGIPNRAGRFWHLVPISLTTLGLCLSVYFVGVMATQLGVWCTLCIAVHVINVLLWIITLVSWPRATGVVPYPSNVRAGIVLGATGASAILLALGVWSVQLQIAARRFQSEYLKVVNDPAYIEWKLSQQSVQEIPVTSDDLVLGKADAKNIVVVFSDFECPNCRMFDQFARRMVNLRMDVRIVLKHFPMSNKCNPFVKDEFHSYACLTAFAAEAARLAAGRDIDKALKYHHNLFDRPEHLGDYAMNPDALAGSAEIDKSSFNKAHASDEVRRKVSADIELGHKLGVEGTPAIFLNGRRMKTNWHLVTNELHPRVDVEATDALWRRLLTTTSPQK